MGYLKVPIDTAGGVTTPTGVLGVTLPSADADTLNPGLPTQVVEPPGARMVAFANGHDRTRLLTKSLFLKMGGIAPGVALVAASTGQRATATFVSGNAANTNPANGDIFALGNATFLSSIRFVTTLTPGSLGWEVKLGSGGTAAQDHAATISNLTKLINNTGTNGVEYTVAAAFAPSFWTDAGIEVSGSSGTTTITLTFRATQYGTGGNAFRISESVDSGGTWSVTAWAGGSTGTGTAPAAGTYRYLYTWFRGADEAETGPSPETTLSKDANDNVAISSLTSSADSTFDYIRVYRTRDTGVEFLLCKTVPSGTTTVTDDIPDDRLELLFGEHPYDDGIHQSYREGYPPIGKYLAVWKTRLWTTGWVGAADYSMGTAAAVKTTTGTDNDTIVLTGAYPTQAWLGRVFTVTTTGHPPSKYKILNVVEATKTLTLDRGYEGINADAVSTAYASVTYLVRDERDPSQVYGSEPGLWNLWPDKNNPGGVDTDDSGGGSGIIGFGDSLIVTSKSSIYRLTGDDEDNWQFHKAVEGSGCAEGRTLVDVPGFGLMWLGNSGILAWKGSGLPSLITSPQRIGKFVRGIEDTIARINWPHVSQAFAHYSEQEKVVRFFVPMDDDVVPRHAIVLEVESPGDWSLDHFPAGATYAATVIGSDGKPLTLIGTQFGSVHHAGLGSYDTTPDMTGVESVVTLTGGTVRTATQGGTTWPTTNSGLAGLPVLIVYANGTAAQNVIISNTSGVLTFAFDLTTAPASGDQVVVGEFWTRWRSGRFVLEEDFSAKVMRDVVVSHSPEADGQYHFATAADQNDTAIPTIGYTSGDLTALTGRRRFRPQARGQMHQIEYNLIEPGTTGRIRGHQIPYVTGAPLKGGG